MAFKQRFCSLKNRVVDYIKNQPLAFVLVTAVFLVTIVFFAFGFKELSARLHFEISEIASCDANLFFTVGKMMTKGYRPYLDYYENKPPMIFIISGLSYLMSGGFYLVNVLSFLCCINLLIMPIVIGITLSIKRKWSLLSSVSVTCALFLTSLLMLFYVEQKSGEIMCELFGVTALIDSVFFLLLLSEDKKAHFYHPLIILSGFFFGISIMFKEPFALMGVFAFLFLVEDKKDLLNKVVYPIGYALFTSIFILLVSNSFVGYFTVYLTNMFGNHINTNGTLFDRMKDFKKIIDNVYEFSKYLCILIIVFLFVSSLRSLTMFSRETRVQSLLFRLFRTLLPFIYLYVASLCVGMGGQYFWHHYVFAAPFYYMLVLDGLVFIGDHVNEIKHYPLKKENTSEILSQLNKPFSLFSLIIVFAIIFISSCGIKTHKFQMKEQEMINYVKRAKNDAKYIDQILDSLNEKEYLFVGFNDTDRPYCYTKHNPLGPCFAQDKDNFQKENNFFVKHFIKQLEKTNTIVFAFNDLGVIKEYTQTYIADNFTITIPDAAKDVEKPSDFRYTMYFRNV